MGVGGRAWAYGGVHGRAWAYGGVHGLVQACTGLYWYFENYYHLTGILRIIITSLVF